MSKSAANTASGADEQTWHSVEIGVPALASGTHVVAVEVHQVSATSSDLGFDLELQGAGLHALLPRPRLVVQALGPDQVQISWPALYAGWVLQDKPDLRDGLPWLPATNAVTEIDGWNTITQPAAGLRYFRLIKE